MPVFSLLKAEESGRNHSSVGSSSFLFFFFFFLSFFLRVDLGLQ